MRGVIVSLLVLAACTTASPDMIGARRHQVVIDNREFVVFVANDRAEVVRVGYLTRNQRRDIPALMARAASRASGCTVIEGSMTTRITGDTGVARFDLDCRQTLTPIDAI